MTPTRALVLAFGPDPDAPPLRGYLLMALPGVLLAVLLDGIAHLLRGRG